MPTTPTLPNTGFLRIKQIIGCRQSNPPVIGLIPVSPAGWWVGVRNGRYPSPIKISPGVTAWRAEDIQALITRLGEEGGNHE